MRNLPDLQILPLVLCLTLVATTPLAAWPSSGSNGRDDGRGPPEHSMALLIADTADARQLLLVAADAIEKEEWVTAELLLEQAWAVADQALRSEISFFWGYSLYRHGEEIVLANTSDAREEAERALGLFEKALVRLAASTHQMTEQVAEATNVYARSMEAIVSRPREPPLPRG